MFDVTDDFLKEEVRDGFKIPSLMKRTWAAQMKLLYQLQAFFRMHGLTYYAEVGSLLGAVRHKGFVPWDDDIDIAMPRADYMRLQELAEKLPYPIRLKSMYTQEDFYQNHSVISNSRENKLTWNEERMAEYFGCPFILGIDVFPMDDIPEDPDERKWMDLLGKLVYAAVCEYDTVFGEELNAARITEYENHLNVIEEKIDGVVFEYDKPLKIQLARLYDRLMMSFPGGDETLFDYTPRMVAYDVELIRKKEWYRYVTELPFENMTIAVPGEYTKVLDTIYGDWHTQVEYASSHEYPFYRTQMEYFTYLGLEEELEKL